MPKPLPILPFVPRNTNQCLDLSLRYFGQFLTVILGMWLLVALPSAAVIYALAYWGTIDVRVVTLVIYFATLPLSVLLMNDAIPRIFGQPFQNVDTVPTRSGDWAFLVSAVLIVLGLVWAFLAANMGDRLGLSLHMRLWSIWLAVGVAGGIAGLGALVSVLRMQRIDWGTARMFFLCLCLRSVCVVGPALVMFPPFQNWWLAVLLVLTILPGMWLAVRTGFVIERTCLRRLDPALHTDRIANSIRSESGELFGRGFWMAVFCLSLWGLAFVTLDSLCSLLFHSPIFLGRFSALPPGAAWEEYRTLAGELLLHDPLMLATMTATALLVHPINRLAWFFCYIDIRVRKDCWDLELQLAHKAEQLDKAIQDEIHFPARVEN